MKFGFYIPRKAAKDRTLLRDSKRMKIACSEKHFEDIDNVHYKVVGSVSV
jgi:type III restriction enzyme